MDGLEQSLAEEFVGLVGLGQLIHLGTGIAMGMEQPPDMELRVEV